MNEGVITLRILQAFFFFLQNIQHANEVLHSILLCFLENCHRGDYH